jgi:hypothetical protein
LVSWVRAAIEVDKWLTEQLPLSRSREFAPLQGIAVAVAGGGFPVKKPIRVAEHLTEGRPDQTRLELVDF